MYLRAPASCAELRTGIGPQGCTLSDATFIPPPPSLVSEALGNLELFLHAHDDLPLLVKIGLTHAHFETIHPFLDGNGRVGRRLITLLLCEREVLQKPVLYLSYYFKRHRQSYYDHLQAVRDHGAWEEWLPFFLAGIAEVSAQATETARRILALRDAHRAQITERMGRAAGNAHRVLELHERPIVSVANVQELLGCTYASANQIVARLSDLGLLKETTAQARHRRFRYEPYVRLFAEH